MLKFGICDCEETVWVKINDVNENCGTITPFYWSGYIPVLLHDDLDITVQAPIGCTVGAIAAIDDTRNIVNEPNYVNAQFRITDLQSNMTVDITCYC